MIEKAFLDTNIIVYLFNKSEKQKQATIKKFIAEQIHQSKIYISIQVINEFINVTYKKITFTSPLSKLKEIIELLNELFFIAPLNYKTTINALDLSGKYKLSFWDSLIISTAIENDCNILYSEDMQNGLIIDNKLKIINPLE